MTKVVAIHSQETAETLALSNFWQTLGPNLFNAAGLHLIPRFGPDATWSNANPHPPKLQAVLQDPDVKLILGLSHSGADSFDGFRFEKLFTKTDVDASVAGKIVHFCSCNPLPDLGQAFIDIGCVVFIGYNVDIMATASDMNTVVRCDSEIDAGLAQGLSVADAMNKAIAAFNAAITTASPVQKQEFAAVRDALACLGNDSLKLSDF